MNPEQIFSICNTLAMLGWITLIFLKFWTKRDLFVFRIIIMLFAIVYSWLIISSFDIEILKNFSTLNGVSILFANKQMLLAGWIHYLAFDLLTGIYILHNARKNGINHWVTAPALFFTFLLGPFGWLLYFIIRLIKTKKYFPDNF